MKMLILILLSLYVSACSTKPMPAPEISGRKAPIVIPEIGGTYIHQNDMEKLRYPEELKAYSIGRLEDAHDPGLMHESHIVYRVESDSAWNLQPGLSPNLPFQLPVSTTQYHEKELLQAELEVKANEQRAMYKYLKEASDKASSQIGALEESILISKKLLAQNSELKKSLSQKNLENQELQKALTTLKNQLQALLKFQQKKEEINIRSKYRR